MIVAFGAVRKISNLSKMIPVLGIFIGFALYHTFSSMSYIELVIIMRLISVSIVLYITYLYFMTIVEDFENDCKGNTCTCVEFNEGLEEVKEMINTPVPTPTKEESAEFADLLSSAEEKNVKKD